MMITGAAPVSPTILTFLRAALGCQVSRALARRHFLPLGSPGPPGDCSCCSSAPQFYEGYGQTECTAGCSMSLPGDWSAGRSSEPRRPSEPQVNLGVFGSDGLFVHAGHVGPPLPCNYVKLVDVAEMNYFAANGEGEVSHRPQLSTDSKMGFLGFYLLFNSLYHIRVV